MSDVKRLIAGIVLVFIGISFLLSSSNGLLPWLGGLIGLAGAYLIVMVLIRGNL